MAKVHRGGEILPKGSTPRTKRYRQTTDRRICDRKDPNVT